MADASDARLPQSLGVRGLVRRRGTAAPPWLAGYVQRATRLTLSPAFKAPIRFVPVAALGWLGSTVRCSEAIHESRSRRTLKKREGWDRKEREEGKEV